MEVLVAVAAGIGLFWLIFLRRYGHGSQKFIIRKRGEYDFEYRSSNMKAAVMNGLLLRFSSRIMNSAFGLIGAIALLKKNNMYAFRTIKFAEPPTFYPNALFEGECAKPGEKNYTNESIEKILRKDRDSNQFRFHSMSDYISLYRSGKLTPTEVADRALRAIEEINQTNAIVKYNPNAVREAAEASTERYKNNATLSPVDGVLVVIKDEYAVKGFLYSRGTRFLGKDEVASYDSDVVSKLRDLGVVILAVANMHELGLGTSGNNPNPGFGACRNPYNTNHYTGGSSSGSAAAVASGVCSMGLGTDGGGSIRIPSSYCGVVGLKPTFARINLHNVHGLSNSVGHCGPICTNVRDTAVFYAMLSGPHSQYRLGMRQPKINLPDFDGDLNGLKIGIDKRYFKDCRPDVYEVCTRSLDHLVACGATITTIEIPELEYVALAHRITILSEMTATINYDFNVNLNDLSLPAQIYFKTGSALSAVDYLQANKQRTRINEFLEDLYKNIDAIVTPTAGHCAPPIAEGDLSFGSLNTNQDSYNMRYAGLGNLTGCPAISIPVGYNSSGLPVGLQFMSAWWREDLVLKIADAVESRVKLQKPQVYVDLLDA